MSVRDQLGDKADLRGGLDTGRAKRGPGRKFSRDMLIRLLAEGVSQTRAADILGITQPAVSVFQKREDVQQAIADLRAGARELGRSRLTGMVRGALDVLDEIMNDRGAEPRDRIAAAKEVLARVYDIELAQAAATALTAEDLALARRFLEERDAETQGERAS